MLKESCEYNNDIIIIFVKFNNTYHTLLDLVLIRFACRKSTGIFKISKKTIRNFLNEFNKDFKINLFSFTVKKQKIKMYLTDFKLISDWYTLQDVFLSRTF